MSACAGQVSLRRGEGVRCADVVSKAMMCWRKASIDVITGRFVRARDTLSFIPQMKCRLEVGHAMSCFPYRLRFVVRV